jgi:hypothetical protein
MRARDSAMSIPISFPDSLSRRRPTPLGGETDLRWLDEDRSFAQLPFSAFESHFKKSSSQFVGHISSNICGTDRVHFVSPPFGVRGSRDHIRVACDGPVVFVNKLTTLAAVKFLPSEKLATGRVVLLSPARGLRRVEHGILCHCDLRVRQDRWARELWSWHPPLS